MAIAVTTMLIVSSLAIANPAPPRAKAVRGDRLADGRPALPGDHHRPRPDRERRAEQRPPRQVLVDDRRDGDAARDQRERAGDADRRQGDLDDQEERRRS